MHPTTPRGMRWTKLSRPAAWEGMISAAAREVSAAAS